MATATSIVGTWLATIDWGCDGTITGTSTWTFNANGTWTYAFGGGFWIQVEGLVAWNFTNTASLIYTANVTLNAIVGIQGYAQQGGIGTGCFYAIRQSGPLAAAAVAAAKEGHDFSVGPPRKKTEK